MPRAQIPPGYARAAAHGVYGPATWVNVFYFSASPAEGSSAQDVCTDVAAYATDYYNKIGLAEFSNQWSVQWVTVTYVDAEGSINRARIADALSGSDDGMDQDAQVAYLINYSVDDSRRGGKARQYVCGVPSSNMADSAKLTSDAMGTINGGLQDWFAEGPAGYGPNATVLELVEMSFVNAGLDIDPPIAHPINGLGLNPVVATQRRRVDRVRPT